MDEPTFRYTTARKEHRAHVKELMSQAVINKTLELEVIFLCVSYLCVFVCPCNFNRACVCLVSLSFFD